MGSFTIGIDIGKKGYICINDNGHYTFHRMPLIKNELDYSKIHKILEPYEGGNGLVTFEKLGVIFGSSKAVAFSMGYQAGAIEMACIALSIPYMKVPPKTWQKELFIGIPEISKSNNKTKSGESRDTKAMALMAAKQLYPTVDIPIAVGTKKEHDGAVDALLICDYGAKRYK